MERRHRRRSDTSLLVEMHRDSDRVQVIRLFALGLLPLGLFACKETPPATTGPEPVWKLLAVGWHGSISPPLARGECAMRGADRVLVREGGNRFRAVQPGLVDLDCGGAHYQVQVRQARSLTILFPERVRVGEVRPLLLKGIADDGTPLDVGPDASWQPSDQLILDSPPGALDEGLQDISPIPLYSTRLRAVAPGSARIDAAFGGLRASLMVQVVPARP